MATLRKTFPIRWHLFAFAVLILLPQIALGLALGAWHSGSERQRVQDGSVAFAVAIRSQLDRELEAMKAALQALATSPNAENEDFPALRRQAEAVLEYRGHLIGVRDRSGQIVMNTAVPEGFPLPVSRNEVVARADAQVFATGKPAVSDLYRGRIVDKPFILVDVPVFVGGEVKYAMNMAISPDVIRDLVTARMIPDGWTIAVLDAQGRILARSAEHASHLGRDGPPSFLRAAGDARSGVVDGVTALDGSTILSAYETLDFSGWRVMVNVPQAVLDAPARNLALTVLAAVLLAVATSALLARVYSRRLECQIQSLHEMAVATGTDAEVRRQPGTVGELEGIAEAIRAADQSLKARERHKDILLAELNHRVRNTLSVLLSVVGATIRGSGSQEPLAKKTAGRIMALSRAHDLLSSSEWSVIALSDLVRKTAQDEQLGIEYAGDEIQLRPEAVAPLAQAFHELASNQRVHGVRTTTPVRVTATLLDGERLRLTWVPGDSGEPGPLKAGFGLRLVELCLERQMFGTIERCDADGLVATLPLEFVTGAGLPTEPFAARWSKPAAGGAE